MYTANKIKIVCILYDCKVAGIVGVKTYNTRSCKSSDSLLEVHIGATFAWRHTIYSRVKEKNPGGEVKAPSTARLC